MSERGREKEKDKGTDLINPGCKRVPLSEWSSKELAENYKTDL